MSEMQDAFETEGVHPFIWGAKGIGKTSLGHTACMEFEDQVALVAAVACMKRTSFKELLTDILDDAHNRQPKLFSLPKVKATFKALGFEISSDFSGVKPTGDTLSINQAARAIDTAFGKDAFTGKRPVIIVDEFDRLENIETQEAFGDLLKQMSVISSMVKICFCGITDDLDEFISAHGSVERYIYGVELKVISHDAIWEIVKDVEREFNVSFPAGYRVRIGQIAAGYPHFAHLILKNTLLKMFENRIEDSEVSMESLREGLNQSSSQAATRLRTAYENAIRKGTDRYIEVLFATANSQHLKRQFKDIAQDYETIMFTRPDRNSYDTKKNNGQDLRNALNSLSQRGVLKKGKTGWYEFSDPMLRSYVRLVAETEGVELSDDAFKN